MYVDANVWASGIATVILSYLVMKDGAFIVFIRSCFCLHKNVQSIK